MFKLLGVLGLALCLALPQSISAQTYGSGDYGEEEYGGTTNMPPSISITAPQNGASFVSETTVTITASSSDSDGSITEVDFLVDNVSIGTSSSPYTIEWTASGNGSRTIAAVATDNEGSHATSTVTVTITEADPGIITAGIPQTLIPGTALPSDFLNHYKSVLIALVLRLQQALGEPAVPAPQVFERDLTVGDTGPDVLGLQQFLNAGGFTLAAEGPGSPGNETTMFGALTRSALAQFQAAHAIAPAIGYFGPITRALINSMQ